MYLTIGSFHLSLASMNLSELKCNREGCIANLMENCKLMKLLRIYSGMPGYEVVLPPLHIFGVRDFQRDSIENVELISNAMSR